MSDPLKDALAAPEKAAEALPDAAEKTPCSPSARSRLLAAATLEGRFARFAEDAAEMLDLPKAEAMKLLDAVDSPGSFGPELPGVEFFWLPGGPKVKDAVRGFVRVDRRAALPEHAHLGEEHVLVMQGVYVDARTGERFGPGTRIHGDAGSTHEFRVDESGTDLLLLVVVQTGYQIGDLVIEPRN